MPVINLDLLMDLVVLAANISSSWCSFHTRLLNATTTMNINTKLKLILD